MAAGQRRQRDAGVRGRHHRVQTAVVQQQALVQAHAAQLLRPPGREPHRPHHRLRARHDGGLLAARVCVWATLKVSGLLVGSRVCRHVQKRGRVSKHKM